LSAESRIWKLEEQYDSLKIKLMRLESSVIKLEGIFAKQQADKIAKLTKKSKLKDHEVEPP